jgi:hypothetical protein
MGTAAQLSFPLFPRKKLLCMESQHSKYLGTVVILNISGDNPKYFALRVKLQDQPQRRDPLAVPVRLPLSTCSSMPRLNSLLYLRGAHSA